MDSKRIFIWQLEHAAHDWGYAAYLMKRDCADAAAKLNAEDGATQVNWIAHQMSQSRLADNVLLAEAKVKGMQDCVNWGGIAGSTPEECAEAINAAFAKGFAGEREYK